MAKAKAKKKRTRTPSLQVRKATYADLLTGARITLEQALKRWKGTKQ